MFTDRHASFKPDTSQNQTCRA
ncbi:hypothetical protein VARIO8X_50037 [Burkholderiales bacterium 8X]|nr:hypothetical protein VARIO8X_50037 [Burkholderiales bacterium 8X]